MGGLVVGDTVQVKLPTGRHRLRIFADQPGSARHLRIVFDPSPGGTLQ